MACQELCFLIDNHVVTCDARPYAVRCEAGCRVNSRVSLVIIGRGEVMRCCRRKMSLPGAELGFEAKP